MSVMADASHYWVAYCHTATVAKIDRWTTKKIAYCQLPAAAKQQENAEDYLTKGEEITELKIIMKSLFLTSYYLASRA